MKIIDHIRQAGSNRLAFNKYNAVELMSQLMGVLQQNGLDDAVVALKKVTPIINKAWGQRGASVRRARTVEAANKTVKYTLALVVTDDTDENTLDNVLAATLASRKTFPMIRSTHIKRH